MPELYTKPLSTPYFFPELPHCPRWGSCCFNCVAPRAALNDRVHKNARSPICMRTPTTAFTGMSFTTGNLNAVFLNGDAGRGAEQES